LANDPFVSESGSDIMQCRSTWNDLAGRAFVFGKHMGHGGIIGVEEFCQVTVGKKTSLLMSLMTESHRFLSQSFARWLPL
jgi:hypothetical protein